MKLDRFTRCLAVVAACSVPALVQAQGFGLNEIGSCAVGRGFAVTSAPCDDASLIYWNPGAAGKLKGWSIYAGAAAVRVTGDFTADTTGKIYKAKIPVEYPPHAFVNYTGNRFSAGLGVYVPYGLTSQWREDFPGRFSALKASLASVYIQPNIAFEFAPGWSIGGGPVIGHSSVELIQGLDLSQQVTPTGLAFGQLGIAPGTEFARANLKGTAMAYGANVGLYGQLTPSWTFGARFLTELKFKYDDADARFTPVPTNLALAPGNPFQLPGGTSVDAVVASTFQAGGKLVNQKVKTQINHPYQFQGGFGFTGIERTVLSLDFAYIGWSAFDNLPIAFQGPASTGNRSLIEDYKDTWSIRAGAGHTLRNGWALRAGFSYVPSPAPDLTVTPLLPDMNRRNYSVGLAVPVGRSFTLDAAYLRVDTPGRRGRVVERESEFVNASYLNGGFYTLAADIVSVSLKAHF